MEIRKRVQINLFLTLLSEAVNRIFPFLIFSVVIRRIGLESFGDAQFSINLLEVCVPLILLGYNQYGTVSVGASIENKTFVEETIANVISLRLIGAVSVLFCIYLSSYFSTSIERHLKTILILSFFLFSSATELNWVQVAMQKTGTFASQSMVVKAFAFLGIWVAVSSPADGLLFAVLFLGSNSLIGLWTFLHVHKRFKLVRPTVAGMKTIFQKSWIYGVPAVMLTGLDRMDLFFAEKYFGSAGIASLTVPSKVGQSLASVILVVSMVFVSELVSQATSKLRSALTERCLNIGLELLVPLTVSGAFLLPYVLGVITSFFGLIEDRILYAILVGVIANFISIVLVYQYYIVEGQVLRCAKILAGVFVLTVLSLSLLQDALGLYGLVLACTTGKILASFLLYCQSRQSVKLHTSSVLTSIFFGVCVFSVNQYCLPTSSIVTSIFTNAVLFLLASIFVWRKLRHQVQAQEVLK